MILETSFPINAPEFHSTVIIQIMDYKLTNPFLLFFNIECSNFLCYECLSYIRPKKKFYSVSYFKNFRYIKVLYVNLIND